MRTRALLAIVGLAATTAAVPAMADSQATPATLAPSVHSLGVCALPRAMVPRGIVTAMCAPWNHSQAGAGPTAPTTPASTSTVPVCVTYAGVNDRCEKWRAFNAAQPAQTATGLPPVSGVAVDTANGLSIIATNSSPGGVPTMGATAYDTRTGTQRWTTSAGGIVPAGVPTASTAIAMTPTGGTVFVVGYVQESITVNQGAYFFYFVVALNAKSGRVLWANRYLGVVGGQVNFATAAVATSSEVVVTGYSRLAGPFQIPPLHYATASFSIRTGKLLWVSRYSGINGQNVPLGIAASPRGDRVYVTGESQYFDPAPGQVYQYATVAYNTRNGGQLWAATRRSPVAASTSFATAIASTSSRVYITGGWQYAGTTAQPQFEYGTVAYSTSGHLLWAANHLASSGGVDIPNDVIAAGDRVIVTGSTSGHDQTVALAAATATVSFPSADTLGYDSSGHLKWTNLYQPQADYASLGTVLAVGPNSTTVYVGGGVGPTSFTTYPFTMAIAASSGQTQWLARDDVRDPTSFSTTLLGVPAEAPVGIGVDAKAGVVVDTVPMNPTLGQSQSNNGAMLLAYGL